MNLRPSRIRARKPLAGSANKQTILILMKSVFGAESVVTEHRFHPTRRWRFDYAIPERKIAVEYQGHGSTGRTGHIGGHASISGMANDCEKLNTAQALGWRVIKLTAFHFTAKDRAKHKLSTVLDTLTSLAGTTS